MYRRPQPVRTPTGEVIVTLTTSPTDAELTVESIDLQILESFPVQVNALVRGQLPDACSFIESANQEHEGQLFHITFTFARRPDARCAPQPTPFEHLVFLDVLGMLAGIFAVEAHDVQASFEMVVDNVLPPVDEPGGWSCSDLGRVPCHPCRFSIITVIQTAGKRRVILRY
jgi:inhibitor of cysteine peptidase